MSYRRISYVLTILLLLFSVKVHTFAADPEDEVVDDITTPYSCDNENDEADLYIEHDEVNGYYDGNNITLYVEGISMYDVAYKVLDLVNAERESNGLNPLEMDQDLLDAAMQRAAECSVLYDKGHLRPTGAQCITVHDKVFGENIAVTYMRGIQGRYTADQLAERVMNGWMNSAGHRANILREGYTTLGVGIFSVDNGYFYSQEFGFNSEVNPVSREEYQIDSVYSIEASEDYITFSNSINAVNELSYSNNKQTQYTVSVLPLYTYKGNTTIDTVVDNSSFSLQSSDIGLANIDEKGLLCFDRPGAVEIFVADKMTGSFLFKTKELRTIEDGLVILEDGRLYYYKDNFIDTTYSSLVKEMSSGKWYYLSEGQIDTNYAGLVKNKSNGHWYYVQNGMINWNYTGLVKNLSNGHWYYVSKGEINWQYTGLAKNKVNGNWYYVKKGMIDFSFTGIAENPANGNSYYVKTGMLDWKYSGEFYDVETKKKYNISNGEVK